MERQEKNFFINSMLFQRKDSIKAFTLVELIVVITILAILGTIAFISLQGYSQDARDSVRTSDISKIKTSLELFQLDAGKYPDTTDAMNITYSGAIVWAQGTFGKDTFKNVEKLDKIPVDPMTGRQYVYSVTNTKQEYQLAGVMEGEIAYNSSLQAPLFLSRVGQVKAGEKKAVVKILGNYNGKLQKVSTGGIDYLLAVPSVVTSSGTSLEEITANNLLAYNGYKNLPLQYAGSSYNVKGEDNLKLVNSSNLVVYSGDLKILSSTQAEGVLARKNLILKLQNAYSSTAIEGVSEIAQIINTDIEDEVAIEFLSSAIISNNLGGGLILSSNKKEDEKVVNDGSIVLGGIKWYGTGILVSSGSINYIDTTSFTYKNDFDYSSVNAALLKTNVFYSEPLTGDFDVNFKINSWQGGYSGFFVIGYIDENGNALPMSELASYSVRGPNFPRRHVPSYTYSGPCPTNILFSLKRTGSNNSFETCGLSGYNSYTGNIRLAIWYYRHASSGGYTSATQTVNNFTVNKATPVR